MAIVKEEETKKRQKNIIGPGFVAPDGGWGWMIVLAAGCSNLCTFPVLQQFGLLFRDRFASLGISTSQITTIINLNSTLTSLIGLANGPMFRRFTYRQVSFCGATLVAIALMMTSFANSVPTYIISFSILYGTGVGISTSANALALNTYFKAKRRIATGFSWTATALGPIVMPYIVTALLFAYDVQGAVLIMSGFALNAVVCSLLLQPVQWHTKKPKDYDEDDLESNGMLVKEPFKGSSYFDDKLKSKSRSLMSSQYIYNEDDEEVPGYEIIDPGTPMLSRANDGWHSSGKRSLMGSRLSLASNRTGKYFDPDSRKTSTQNLARSKKNSITNLNDSNRNSKYSNPSSKKNSNQNLSKFGLISESRSRVNSSTNLTDISKSRRNSGTNLNANEYSEIRKSRRRHKSIRIEESEAENCPSNIAPQDLRTDDVEDANDVKPDVIQEGVKEPNEVKKKTEFLNVEETEGDKTPTTRSALRRDPSYTGNLRGNKSYADLKDTDKKRTVTIEGVSEAKYFKDNHSIKSLKNSEYRKRSNTFNLEKEVLRVASKKLEEYAELTLDDNDNDNDPDKDNKEGGDDYDFDENDEDQTLMDEEEMEKKMSFIDKVVIFFDLDLLRDFTYVNLMLGITFANFAELNFSILTPFVLGDFGFTQPEIALVMSLLGGCDIGVRFLVPFIAGKIGWENRTFFLFGVLAMAGGRVILAHFHTFPITIMVACLIGCGKGLRTVFMALVIPSYIPLERLPGATGLQLLSAGLLYLVAGPVIGWIRDTTNYPTTLHCLNLMTYSVAISWGLEKLHSVRKQRRKEAELNAEL